MNIFGKRSDLPLLRKSDRKKEREQNIICRQTQLDDIAPEYAVICRSDGGLSANKWGRKIVSNDNYFCFSGSPPVSQDEVEGIGFARDLTVSVLLSVFVGFLYNR